MAQVLFHLWFSLKDFHCMSHVGPGLHLLSCYRMPLAASLGTIASVPLLGRQLLVSGGPLCRGVSPPAPGNWDDHSFTVSLEKADTKRRLIKVGCANSSHCQILTSAKHFLWIVSSVTHSKLTKVAAFYRFRFREEETEKCEVNQHAKVT